MKKNKIRDERIEITTNKIFKETFFIIVTLLLVEIFYKSYIKNMSVETYLREVCILVIAVIYIAVREMMNGNGLISISRRGKLFNLAAVFLLSCIITVSNSIRNYSRYADKYDGILDIHFIAVVLVSFISSVIFLSGCSWILYKLHKIGKQKMDKCIDDMNE